jgi:hypothetical protein
MEKYLESVLLLSNLPLQPSTTNGGYLRPCFLILHSSGVCSKPKTLELKSNSSVLKACQDFSKTSATQTFHNQGFGATHKDPTGLQQVQSLRSISLH